MEWIDAFPDDAVFWDIGANIGTFALYAGFKPVVRVLAFEPAASSFAVLNRNIELNSLDRITAYCIAFAGDTRLASFNMASTSPGASMHGFGTERNQFGGAIDVNFSQGAVGFSIDDFVTMFSPLLPTHVKIDVDGIGARYPSRRAKDSVRAIGPVHDRRGRKGPGYAPQSRNPGLDGRTRIHRPTEGLAGVTKCDFRPELAAEPSSWGM